MFRYLGSLCYDTYARKQQGKGLADISHCPLRMEQVGPPRDSFGLFGLTQSPGTQNAQLSANDLSSRALLDELWFGPLLLLLLMLMLTLLRRANAGIREARH